jgi:coenzyme PQQ precursor peptide PqqA
MMPLIQWPALRAEYRQVANLRRTIMTWETPQAVELRFGMEITMYVSNR